MTSNSLANIAMVGGCGILVLTATTVLHYEVLRTVGRFLPRLHKPGRARLIVVIFATFLAHLAEIALYAGVMHGFVHYSPLGSLGDPAHYDLSVALYFSAETFSSLGYGDVLPTGPLRLLAGIEALNGLLLMGWSASYTYLAMERYWGPDTQG
jgi:hypothetical protein